MTTPEECARDIYIHVLNWARLRNADRGPGGADVLLREIAETIRRRDTEMSWWNGRTSLTQSLTMPTMQTMPTVSVVDWVMPVSGSGSEEP